MKVVKKFFWFLYQIFAVYTIVVIMLMYWTPFSHWIAGFMMMSFPVTVIINFVAIIFWLLADSRKTVLPVLLVFLSGIFLSRTYSFSPAKNIDTGRKSFKVANYNIKSLRLNEKNYSGRKKDIGGLMNWIFTSNADILCLPEYYSEKSDGNFPFTAQLKSRGYRFYRTAEKSPHANLYMGLAVFSKYPIIASKDTVFEAQNGMIRVDVRINKDTVRIIGVHLYSMSLQLDLLRRQKKMAGLKIETKGVLKQIKKGFVLRSEETKILESWIEDSPFPVIVCGDFNETPYSYVYGRLRDHLANAFEEGGKGFGFTYNHLPYFIRIDHQFYDSKKLNLINFQTVNSIPYSDHYPLTGTYQIEKK